MIFKKGTKTRKEIPPTKEVKTTIKSTSRKPGKPGKPSQERGSRENIQNTERKLSKKPTKNIFLLKEIIIESILKSII